MTRVSIVIPIYNRREFLPECLDSILTQSYENLEIICIDDCSTDGSFELLKEYAEKDSRIKIFQNTKNSGVSFTRNLGLKYATGEYIHFLDSDDFINRDFYKSLIENSETSSKDLIYCNCLKVDLNGIEREYRFSEEDKPLEKWSTSTVWFYIFKRELILDNEIKFPENIDFAEDNLFSFLLFKKIKTFSHSTSAVYYYRQHSGSITSNIYENKEKYSKFCDDRLKLWDILINNYNTRCKEDKKKFMESYLTFFKMLYNDFNITYIDIKTMIRLLRKQQMLIRAIPPKHINRELKKQYNSMYNSFSTVNFMRKKIISFKFSSRECYFRIFGYEIYRREFCAE